MRLELDDIGVYVSRNPDESICQVFYYVKEFGYNDLGYKEQKFGIK